MTAQLIPPNKLNSVNELRETISTMDWMSSLPTSLHNLPITKLTIPGTHNSGTFSLSEELSPDADSGLGHLTRIPLIGSIVKKTIVSWARCQNLDFTEQCQAGIRYFDLRVAPGSGSEDFFLVHTVFGAKLSDLLDALSTFLEAHPHEVVLLDFNHFYGMGMSHHKLLINYLISKIGSKLRNRCPITDLTLHNLWSRQKQVIIFYQNVAAIEVNELWPRDRISSPWPNTDNPHKCRWLLNQCFSVPHAVDFTVCQGVLTPNFKTIMKDIWHNGCVRGLSLAFLPHLCELVTESQQNFTHPPNIIISDFAEDGDLIQIILQLNYK